MMPGLDARQCAVRVKDEDLPTCRYSKKADKWVPITWKWYSTHMDDILTIVTVPRWMYDIMCDTEN